MRPIRALILAAALLCGCGAMDRTAECRRSINVLLHEKLSLPNGAIVREYMADARGPDPGATWEATETDSDALAAALARNGFARSDDSDDQYFRESAARDLAITLADDFHAYEAGLVLGDGTICDTLRCNIVVIRAPGKPAFYVLIWKI